MPRRRTPRIAVTPQAPDEVIAEFDESVCNSTDQGDSYHLEKGMEGGDRSCLELCACAHASPGCSLALTLDAHARAPRGNSPRLASRSERCAHASRPALPHRRTYAAMILSMDRAFEKTAGALRTEGMLDNTLVAFMSDNGGPAAPIIHCNGGLRTHRRDANTPPPSTRTHLLLANGSAANGRRRQGHGLRRRLPRARLRPLARAARHDAKAHVGARAHGRLPGAHDAVWHLG